MTQAGARGRASRPRPSGNHVGDIGNAIETVVLKGGFAVVRELVGHGVGQLMHEEPQVPNHGKPKRGMQLCTG